MGQEVKKLRSSFLFEKAISIIIAFVGLLLTVIGILVMGYVNNIDKNFEKLTAMQKESNQLARGERNHIRSDISGLRHIQQTGREKVVTILGEHKTRIEIVADKVDKLEQYVYRKD